MDTVLRYLLLGAATCFVLGLHLMNRPATARRGNLLSAGGMAVAVAATATLLVRDTAITATGWLVLLTGAALGSGVTMVLPIGGADMPVVISLLNAFTGTAVAMAGFVLGETALIVAGALVGASGGILTKLMADAMNRSIPNIIIG